MSLPSMRMSSKSSAEKSFFLSSDFESRSTYCFTQIDILSIYILISFNVYLLEETPFAMTLSITDLSSGLSIKSFETLLKNIPLFRNAFIYFWHHWKFCSNCTGKSGPGLSLICLYEETLNFTCSSPSVAHEIIWVSNDLYNSA